MTLSQLFGHNKSQQITNIVKQLSTTMFGEFDASKLLKGLDELEKPFQSFHWLFSSLAVMIGCLLIDIFITFALWKKCCTKSLDPPAFPAPLAPPAINPNPVPFNPMTVTSQPASPNFQKLVAPKSIMIINP
jgi:hypothetical protein